ncbi:MAG: copper chaperone PCu(A)C [Rickettsiales bacterium]|nr:copper chaperone PCu(A)C [Rickettsiales bacterium]
MRHFIAFIALSLISSIAHAETIDILEPWAKSTLVGADVGAAYFLIQNRGTTNRTLVSVSSPVSERVEIHTHVKEGDVMQMRQLGGLTIPPGAIIRAEPGSVHIMFIGLEKELRKDTAFPVTFGFQDGGSITARFIVKADGN